MKVYIFNENCVMAGQAVPQRIIEQHDDPDNGGDWTMYDDEPSELLAIADGLDQLGCQNGYNRKVARTLREATA